jgi:hypothetical protein
MEPKNWQEIQINEISYGSFFKEEIEEIEDNKENQLISSKSGEIPIRIKSLYKDKEAIGIDLNRRNSCSLPELPILKKDLKSEQHKNLSTKPEGFQKNETKWKAAINIKSHAVRFFHLTSTEETSVLKFINNQKNEILSLFNDEKFCHLDTMIYQYVKKHKSMEIKQDFCFNTISNDLEIPSHLFNFTLKKLEKLKELLGHQEQLNSKALDWLNLFNNHLDKMINLFEKKQIIVEDLKKEFDEIKDVEIKNLIQDFVGKNILNNLKNLESIILNKVKRSLNLLTLQESIVKQYSIKGKEETPIQNLGQEILRSIYPAEVKECLFKTFKIEQVFSLAAVENNQSIDIKIALPQQEFFQEILTVFEKYGWKFEEKLEDQAEKIVSQKAVSCSRFFGGLTNITLNSVNHNRKSRYYHPKFYNKAPYYTVQKGANGGGIEAVIRLYLKENYIATIRKFTEIIYAYKDESLTVEEIKNLPVAMGTEEGRGRPICELEKEYILIQYLDAENPSSWDFETKINRIEFKEGASYRLIKDILLELVTKIPNSRFSSPWSKKM